jgi:hypothetical protein
MPRVTLGARLAGAGLIGAGLMLVVPAAAQASPATHIGETWFFSGYTFPDTSAGYSACAADGEFEVSLGGAASNWSCELGNPNAGVYNLWIADFNVGP